MKRIIFFVLIFLPLAMTATDDSGFHPFKPDAIGGQFVGTRQDASQMPGSGIGPGLSIVFRYDLSPRVVLDFGTGFSTATDDVLKQVYAESIIFPNFTLRTNFKLVTESKMTPIFYLGLMGARVSRSEHLPNRPAKEMTFSDLGFLFGSGFVYKSYYNFSINMNADYRYAAFSSSGTKSKYWVFETGVSFPLNLERPEEKYKDDFFIPQDENEVAAVVEPKPPVMNDDFSVFLYKVETLLERIESKQKMLEDLEERVLANEKAIATVTGFVASEFVNYTDVLSTEEMQSGPENDQDYMTIYQNALASFNAKQYNQAIRLFDKLLFMNSSHPLASNCQYWVGESYHALNDYAHAAEAFSSVLEYTLSSKYDDALLMNGICQLELGNIPMAREYFSKLVNEYPESEYVPRANDYLRKL